MNNALNCWFEMAHDETRFIVLRQRLSNLGYQAQTFSMDSADLVDQLLLDLTSTTESYETLKLKDTKLSQDLALAQAQLFPLRKENARLARENYQVLHITIHIYTNVYAYLAHISHIFDVYLMYI